MLNFHTLTFLDVKRYEKLINENIYLSYFNPKYLFLWKEFLKPEIYFKDNSVYLRLSNLELGLNYYSIIHNDYNYVAEIKNENNILGPILDEEIEYFKKYNYEVIENKIRNSYLYKPNDFLIYNKKYKSILRAYEKVNKASYVKIITREDEKDIISYAAYILKEDKDYFKILLMLKNFFEYLNELDLFGLILFDNDNYIKGFICASLFKNTIFIHKIITDDFNDFIYLMNNFSKLYAKFSTYINIEEEDINIKLKNDGLIKPSFIEKYYMIYNL